MRLASDRAAGIRRRALRAVASIGCGFLAACAESSGVPDRQFEPGGTTFVVRVPEVASIEDRAGSFSFEQQVVVCIDMFLKPDWWQGEVEEVRFRGGGFELGEPGFWGRYEGAWSFLGRTDPPDASPRGYWSLNGSAVPLDARTWRADRPGQSLDPLLVRTAGRVTLAATSVERLDAASGDHELDLGGSERDDFVLRARTADLEDRGLSEVIVRASWSDLAAGDGYSIQCRCAGGAAGVRAFLASWPAAERLGAVVELTDRGDGRVGLRMGFAPARDVVDGLLWAWHDLAGFRTFI